MDEQNVETQIDNHGETSNDGGQRSEEQPLNVEKLNINDQVHEELPQD